MGGDPKGGGGNEAVGLELNAEEGALGPYLEGSLMFSGAVLRKPLIGGGLLLRLLPCDVGMYC